MNDLTLFQKYEDGKLCKANSVYDPLCNDKIFRMTFNNNLWFEREKYWLTRLSRKSYVPEIVKIDDKKLIIDFKWYNKSLNHLIHFNQYYNLNDVKSVIKDLEENGIYKLNIFPHTFFYDNTGQIKTMDFYGCLSKNKNFSKNFIENIVNDKERFAFKKNYVDIIETYRRTKQKQLNYWPEKVYDC